MFALAELHQATHFRDRDANSREITGPHCAEFIKNTVVTFQRFDILFLPDRNRFMGMAFIVYDLQHQFGQVMLIGV